MPLQFAFGFWVVREKHRKIRITIVERKDERVLACISPFDYRCVHIEWNGIGWNLHLLFVCMDGDDGEKAMSLMKFRLAPRTNNKHHEHHVTTIPFQNPWHHPPFHWKNTSNSHVSLFNCYEFFLIFFYCFGFKVY